MKSIVLTSTANWAAVSDAFTNQQRIPKAEAAVPYHPSQRLMTVTSMLDWLLL
jgi:hypothetical protein